MEVNEYTLLKNKDDIPFLFLEHQHHTLVQSIKNLDDCVELLEIFNYKVQYQENVYLLCLNNCNIVLSASRIAKCTSDCCLFPIKEIIMHALMSGASCIIVAHNHPSNGNISIDDIESTKKLKRACELVDIVLLDSVVLKDKCESIIPYLYSN